MHGHTQRPVCRRDFVNGRRNAHALCMNACIYTLDQAGFIPGGTSRCVETREECESKRAKRALRRDARIDAARPRGPLKGLSRDRIFSISVREYVLTSIRIKIGRRRCFSDSSENQTKYPGEEIKPCKDIVRKIMKIFDI